MRAPWAEWWPSYTSSLEQADCGEPTACAVRQLESPSIAGPVGPGSAHCSGSVVTSSSSWAQASLALMLSYPLNF